MATVWAESIIVVCGLLTAPLPPALFFFVSQKKGGGKGPQGGPSTELPQPPHRRYAFFLFGVRRIQLWWRSLIESVSSWTCASFTLSRAQQTLLGKLGEEVERSLRRRTTHDHVQRAFGRGNNSKRGINS